MASLNVSFIQKFHQYIYPIVSLLVWSFTGPIVVFQAPTSSVGYLSLSETRSICSPLEEEEEEEGVEEGRRWRERGEVEGKRRERGEERIKSKARFRHHSTYVSCIYSSMYSGFIRLTATIHYKTPHKSGNNHSYILSREKNGPSSPLNTLDWDSLGLFPDPPKKLLDATIPLTPLQWGVRHRLNATDLEAAISVKLEVCFVTWQRCAGIRIERCAPNRVMDPLVLSSNSHSPDENGQDKYRFQVELEFVQCLANPKYLNCNGLLASCLIRAAMTLCCVQF